MSNNLSELLHKINFNTNQKIGSTTTINQQLDQMNTNMYQFKRYYEIQQKEQSELQFNLKKFEQAARTNLKDMNKQLTQRLDYLTRLFDSDCEKLNGQMQYLEQQNKILHDEHDKLNEVGSNTEHRTQNIQNSVGI